MLVHITEVKGKYLLLTKGGIIEVPKTADNAEVVERIMMLNHNFVSTKDMR